MAAGQRPPHPLPEMNAAGAAEGALPVIMGALNLGSSGSTRCTPAPRGDTRACLVRYPASDFCGKTNGPRSGCLKCFLHPSRCPVAECFVEGVGMLIVFPFGFLQGLKGKSGRGHMPRPFHFASAVKGRSGLF